MKSTADTEYSYDGAMVMDMETNDVYATIERCNPADPSTRLWSNSLKQIK